jgi:VanZ family protein
MTAFAGLIELAQLWAPDRHARLSDFVVDALAACAGVAIASTLSKSYTSLRGL